jgi:hypothetical protein
MSKTDPYRTATIPLPSAPLRITETDTRDEVCEKLDRFFDDLIRNYPPKAQSLLKGMYYEDENIFSVPDAIENRWEANWVVSRENGMISYEMRVDVNLVDCPVLLRCNKIHEIACHLGQVHERISEVGFDGLMKDLQGETPFRRLLEQSVAPAEKMMVDAIPMRIFEEDLALIPKDSARDSTRADILYRKEISYDAYVRLCHRQIDPLSASVTAKDHARLHSRPEVAAFDALMRGQKASAPAAPKSCRNDVHFR